MTTAGIALGFMGSLNDMGPKQLTDFVGRNVSNE